MMCPFCGYPEDHVVDSRSVEDSKAIRRRRECEKCSGRFTTYERVEEPALMVVKRSGDKEPFNKEKLLSGLRKACVNRPVTEDALLKLADDLVESVKDQGRSVVESADLGKEILERMRVLDDVAYLRFASVYKDFQELNDFEKELGILQKKVPPKSRAGARK